MSSEVMTHENWARLHVARRVSDIAKSMIKLSRLGRSIFPTPSHPLPGEAKNSPLVLRFRRPPASAPAPQRLIRETWGAPISNEPPSNRDRCSTRIPRAGLGFPALPSSPRQAGTGLGPCPGGGRHGGRPSPGVVRRANIVVGADPWPLRGGRRERSVAGPDPREVVVHPRSAPHHPVQRFRRVRTWQRPAERALHGLARPRPDADRRRRPTGRSDAGWARSTAHA